MASDPPPPPRSTVFQTVWWDSVSVAQLYFNTYCIPHFFLKPHLLSSVIGRGGEQINKIQQESGCKVQIAPGTGCTRRLQILILGVNVSVIWGFLFSG